MSLFVLGIEKSYIHASHADSCCSMTAPSSKKSTNTETVMKCFIRADMPSTDGYFDARPYPMDIDLNMILNRETMSRQRQPWRQGANPGRPEGWRRELQQSKLGGECWRKPGNESQR
jgi:hypothetical protein